MTPAPAPDVVFGECRFSIGPAFSARFAKTRFAAAFSERGSTGREAKRIAVPQIVACLCAQGDSNSHGPYGPQGPQPCASTNSATGAWSLAIIGLEGVGLDVVRQASYSANTRSDTSPGRLAAVDLKLTKRQQEIFEFIKRYSAK